MQLPSLVTLSKLSDASYRATCMVSPTEAVVDSAGKGVSRLAVNLNHLIPPKLFCHIHVAASNCCMQNGILAFRDGRCTAEAEDWVTCHLTGLSLASRICLELVAVDDLAL